MKGKVVALDFGGEEPRRKTRRNRQPRCVSMLRWKYFGRTQVLQCWSRVEKGQTLCIHCRTGSRGRYTERVGP